MAAENFFSGLAAGMQQAQQRKMQQQNADRTYALQLQSANREQEKWDMQKSMMQQQKAIMQQFGQISQTDGMGKALDFLQGVDPKSALEYRKTIGETQKVQMETLKTVAEMKGIDITNQSKMDELMTQGYNQISGAMTTVSKLPPEMQQKVFEVMLPSLQQINKNFPTDLESAKVYGLAARALSIPQNKIYEAEVAMRNSNSEAMKALDQLRSDPGLDERAKGALWAIVEKQKTDNQLNIAKQMEASMKLSDDKVKTLTETYSKQTEEFQRSQQLYQELLKLGQAVGPDQGVSDLEILRKFLMISNPEAAPPRNAIDMMEHLSTIPGEFHDQVEYYLQGKSKFLEPSIRNGLINAASNMMQIRSQNYDTVRQTIVDQAIKNHVDPNLVSPDYREQTIKVQANSLNKTIAAGIQGQLNPNQVAAQLDTSIAMVQSAIVGSNDPAKAGALKFLKDAAEIIRKGAPVDKVLPVLSVKLEALGVKPQLSVKPTQANKPNPDMQNAMPADPNAGFGKIPQIPPQTAPLSSPTTNNLSQSKIGG